MPSVRNGFIIVNYDLRGAGTAAILFNHTSTSNLSWSERFLESLAEELTVVTPDYRGFIEPSTRRIRDGRFGG
jgi:hypothetical protein